MVMLHDEEDPHYDDATIQMELQQFLDEWHYRILHSGLAIAMDRVTCLRLAMDIFEMHGMEVTAEEKEEFVVMEDEAEMITAMVKHLPMNTRKTFEHFVLQLQLVVSTTTQVRHALEEGIPEEVAKCFDGGDTGPGQQILKQSIVEAGKQIHQAVEMHKSWKENTETRIKRLAVSQDEAEHARQQLAAVMSQVDSFGSDQNKKSKSVLIGIAAKNDKQFLHTMFSAWLGWLMKHQFDKEIHDKFKKEITDAEDSLIAFKQKQMGISKGMLGRSAAQGDQGLQGEVLRIWYKYVVEEGHNKEMDSALAAANAKFNDAQQSSKDASKKVMDRMSAGNDSGLVTLCFQTWVGAMEEMKKDKEIDELAKKAEQQYKDFKDKKSAEAKGVLDRMSSGSDTGLLHMIFMAWTDEMKSTQADREMEKIMQGQNDKFKSLNMKQKGAAKSVASKCHQQEEENMIMAFFYSWATETRCNRVLQHYSGKLEQKHHQLHQVQSMFQNFASQLEKGIGDTPRSQRKSAGRKSSASSAAAGQAPPPLPAS